MSGHDTEETLTREFSNAVSKPHIIDQKLQEYIHHQSVNANIENDEGVSVTTSGYLSHSVGQNKDEAPNSKKKQERDFINSVLYDAVRNFLYVLEQQIGMLKVLRDEALAQIEENNERLLQIGNRLDGIEYMIQEIETAGDVSINHDGTLSDSRAEEAVREYEQRTGNTVDRNNIEELYSVLIQQQEYERTERGRLEKENERLQKELDDINEDLVAFQGRLDQLREQINHGEFTTDNLIDEIRNLNAGQQIALLEHPDTSEKLKRIITEHQCKVDPIDQDTVNLVNMTLEKKKSVQEQENTGRPSCSPFTPTTSL